ncbi:MAG: type II toxin-antitoxin system death-on-curing family toxin [Gemmatimonadaceae bacterium]|nr:type II toxin-antitoxin system death-on-curing family toxin [Gemmatimonadaceae bacterium]
MREPRWVPRALVEAVHLDQLRAHGGMPGLRDEGALESALARPCNKLAYGKRVDHASLAAAYAFGLARNHPFNDGNKRIAFLVAVIFLGLNGWDFVAPDADVVAHMVALADGRLTEAKLAKWLRAGLVKLPQGAA